jgi:hypothetical protein
MEMKEKERDEGKVCFTLKAHREISCLGKTFQ